MARDKSRRLSGDGTIRQRADGRWEGRTTVGMDYATGKQIQKSLYAPTLKELRRKMREYAHTQTLPQPESPKPEKPSIPFAEWLDVWMSEYKKNSVSPSTYDSYNHIIKNHIKPSLGNLSLTELTPTAIQQLLNHMQEADSRKDRKDGGLSSWTVLKTKNIIHSALKQALRNGHIDRNPTDAVIPPKLHHKDIRILTPDEQAKLIQALSGHRLEALFQLALASGMRRGELLALTWDCVDLRRQTISIKHSVSRQSKDGQHSSLVFTDPKTSTGRRQVPIISSLVPILEKHKERQDTEKRNAGSAYNEQNLVFCSNVGTIIEPRRVNTTLNKLIQKAGIEHVTFHALRHTFATRALENGVSAKVVQDVLGHADVTLTLNTYSHVLQTTAHDQLAKMNSIFCCSDTTAAVNVVKSKKPKDRER